MKGERLRFVTQNWDVLEMHYLRALPARKISYQLGRAEEVVNEIIAKSWEMGIDHDVMRDYMASR